MPLSPGARVDRYTIVELLGAGAMGEVYRAIDSKLERAVALKVLRVQMTMPGSAGDTASAARRMLREAKAVAALEHPNVIAIYDVGELEDHETGTTTFLAMELVKGKTLRAYVGDPSIPMDTRVRWLTEIARALAAAHRAGVIHRDVKPDNVMVKDDGVVKVLDFGIAKRTAQSLEGPGSTETVTREGIVIGTPYYMAPEQMRGHAMDGRADQFSWAVLAYELMTGKRPWAEGDALQLVAEVLSHVPASPSVRDPKIPLGLSRAIQRALEKKPEDRFASMDDLIAVLESKDSMRAPPPMLSPAAQSVGLSREHVAIVDASPLAATQAELEVIRVPTGAQRAAEPKGQRWPVILAVSAIAAVALTAGVILTRGKHDAPATTAPTAAAGCTSSLACSQANGGAPYVCRHADGACVALESVDCKVKADKRALESDETVWVGAMYPQTGEDAKDYGISETHGAELAQRDFAEILGGVPGARPFGLIVCDDAVDAKRAAQHLADDVRVPAVIGFRSSEEVVRLAPEIFFPKGMLVLSTINASPMITSLPVPAGSPRLVWRTMFSTRQFAKPVSAFVNAVLEPRVSKGRSSASPPVRMAFVRIKTLSELALSDALLGTLTFNGKSALVNGANFREIVLDDPSAPNAKPDYAGAVENLLTFAPDIIVFDSGDALMSTVFFPLEAKWPNGESRPLYACANPLSRNVAAFVGKDAARRHRFFGLTNVSTTSANARLVTHYNETFSDKVIRTASPNSTYDGFYVLAYAAMALGEAPITGASLVGAIPKLLPPGKTVDVGPLGIMDAYGQLSRGQGIDLDGTIGRLDFDVSTGEAPIDMAVLCIGTDHRGLASEAVESGLVYDSRSGTLTGKLDCP